MWRGYFQPVVFLPPHRLHFLQVALKPGRRYKTNAFFFLPLPPTVKHMLLHPVLKVSSSERLNILSLRYVRLVRGTLSAHILHFNTAVRILGGPSS